MYKATAIVSTYKSESYLEGRLIDLLQQTEVPEIVVIANSPTEREIEILEKYIDKITLEIVERESLYKSWNRAVKLSTTEFLFNANTDDRHSPEYVKTMLEEIEGYDLIYADQYIVKEIKPFSKYANEPIANYVTHNKSYIAFGCYFSSSPFWRKSLHDTYGYFREDFYSSGDWEMWCRLAEVRIKKVNKVLSAYYDNPQGIFNNSETKESENEIIVKEYYNKYYRLNISACMIVKNEGKNLKKCLTTIKDLCKEIVIVDTGSSDNTPNIVQGYINKGYNVKYYKYSKFNTDEDIDDFSYARNEALSYASGDWILSIDADEFLPYDAICKIVELLESDMNCDYYLTRQFSPGGLADFTYHERLFKNGIGIQWKNIIHEIIETENLKGAKTNIYIYHSGYSDKYELERKAERNLKLHYKQLLNEPDNQYIHVNLALLYFYLEDNKQAVENSIIALVCKDINNDTKARLCIMLFVIFTQNKSYLTAINFLHQSVKLVPNQIYSHWLLADISMQMKKYNEAENELNFLSDFLENKKTTELNNDMILDLQTLKNKIKENKKCQTLQAVEQ